MARLILLALVLILPAAGQAQPVVLEPAALLDLARRPYLDRAAMRDRLAGGLGGFVADRPAPVPALVAGDPFYWALAGRFGAPLPVETGVPGGLAICARYGLETRDLLAGMGLSDPRAFALLRQALILADDAAAWPEGAVARLACSITWDDARRVAPLSGEGVRALLDPVFDTVQGRIRQVPEAEGPRVFGPPDYRIGATGGPRDAAVFLESVRIERLATHQRIRLRAFLMGGGA